MNKTQSVGGGGAFLTQKGEKYQDVRHEINELEQLLAAAGQTSQSTLLLKKKKEMREIDEALELMKRDHMRRMDICEQRRLIFEEKQAKMRDQVLAFEKFIQENDAKRQRAEVRARQEQKLFHEKVREIEQLEKTIARLNAEKSHLSSDLQKKKKYKDFLDRIVDDDEYGYDEINEVLNRHSTLKQANRDLQGQAAELEDGVDRVTKELQLLRTEKQNQMLVSTSAIQGLQAELERRRLTAKLHEEDNVLRIDKKKGVSQEYTQIVQAVKNLYSRCLATMSAKAAAGAEGGAKSSSGPSGTGNGPSGTSGISGKDNTGTSIGQQEVLHTLTTQLEVISARICDLLEIVREYHAIDNSSVGQMSASSSNLLAVGASGTLASGDLKEPSMSTLPSVNNNNTCIRSLKSHSTDPKR
jgi:hypothetical protein